MAEEINTFANRLEVLALKLKDVSGYLSASFKFDDMKNEQTRIKNRYLYYQTNLFPLLKELEDDLDTFLKRKAERRRV